MAPHHSLTARPHLTITRPPRSLRALFDEFVRECEFTSRLRTETVRGYKQTFATFEKLIPNASLESLTSATLTEFFRTLGTRTRIVGNRVERSGIKTSTVLTYWSKLNQFFEWLRVKGLMEGNPLKAMKYPSVSYEDRQFLKRDAVKRILTAIASHPERGLLLQKRDVLVFHLLLYCGLRRSELMLLEVSDIDSDRRVLRVRGETSKSKRTRMIPLHSSVLACCKDYMRERNRKGYRTPYLIVSNNRDERLTLQGLQYWAKKLKDLSGVRFHLHQFRHTFAMNFLKGGGDVAKLKHLMGHTDLRMTLTYLRAMPTDEMRADIENINIDNLMQ